MKLLALTGGIGSGKSSVSSRLSARGAAILDADAIVKELQRPGRPVFEEMVARWGDRIVGADGELDRQAVAGIVFADRAELEALNELVHPAVRADMAERLDRLGDTDQVVIQDIPLLAESDRGRGAASAVIVVDCPVEVAVERLITHRGFKRSDAEARVAAQATREQRLALADFVVDNGGSLDDLDGEVERCWAWIGDLDPTPWPPSD